VISAISTEQADIKETAKAENESLGRNDFINTLDEEGPY
jgi:hypothetical protein